MENILGFIKEPKLWKRKTNEDRGMNASPCCNKFLPIMELIPLEV
jgi:hypothetical protein